MSLFQSYLIIGSQKSARQSSHQLAKNHGVDLGETSPDTFFISPQKSSIGIAQIRELKNHIFQKPVKDKFKFVIIEQAEKLTTEAQNALLKILEEPPSHAIIALEAKNKSSILPTIQSRTVIRETHDDIYEENDIDLLANDDIAVFLQKIAQIENPSSWLDNQIIALYNQLKENIRARERTFSSAAQTNVPVKRTSRVGLDGPATSDVAQITTIIEKCAQTKQMIEANVNPRFVLINLILNLKINNSTL